MNVADVDEQRVYYHLIVKVLRIHVVHNLGLPPKKLM